jgi:hypothetical protein
MTFFRDNADYFQADAANADTPKLQRDGDILGDTRVDAELYIDAEFTPDDGHTLLITVVTDNGDETVTEVGLRIPEQQFIDGMLEEGYEVKRIPKE